MPLRPPALTLLLLAAATAGAAQAGEAPQAEAGAGYFRRHLLHWVTAFGASLLDSEYERVVGTSTDPLLFSDPPGVDRRVRDRLGREDPGSNFFLDNAGWLSAAIAAGAAVSARAGPEGSGRALADDLTGIAEVWFFDKGSSGLVKNIVGRQRPELEFLDESDLTPAQRQEEIDKRTNRQSFYSGAASRTFSLLSYADQVAARRLGPRRGARALCFAGFHAVAGYVGYSRIMVDKHYLSDVLAGAAAGIAIGRGFHRAHHRATPARTGTSAAAKRPRLAALAVGREGLLIMVSVPL